MIVQAADLKLFRERFYDFQDGVVCFVDLKLRATPCTCRIEIQCMDRDSASGWSTVTLNVQVVSEFRFQVGRTTFEVLSGGIQFAWRDKSIYVVLDAYPDDGTDLPDIAKNIAYVVGESCEWSSADYIPESQR